MLVRSSFFTPNQPAWYHLGIDYSGQVEPEADVSIDALTSALSAIGFVSTCIATSTTAEPTLEDGVNAVWAIASALGEGGRQTGTKRTKSTIIGPRC